MDEGTELNKDKTLLLVLLALVQASLLLGATVFYLFYEYVGK